MFSLFWRRYFSYDYGDVDDCVAIHVATEQQVLLYVTDVARRCLNQSHAVDGDLGLPTAGQNPLRHKPPFFAAVHG